jgi:REP element-mobilizing transposase RayT
MNEHDPQGNKLPLSTNSASRLPLRGSRNFPRRAILASHLVFTGYAHWLPNDLRGSGSDDVRKDQLQSLGELLPGRQYPQPPRDDVRQFFRSAEDQLEHERIWFRGPQRAAIAQAFGAAASSRGYTLWACAICSNHAHVVVRTHRDKSEVIWSNLAQAAALALRGANVVPSNHPVWSHRPYKVFLHTHAEVIDRIGYVNDNPEKEGLARQHWAFVERCPFDPG